MNLFFYFSAFNRIRVTTHQVSELLLQHLVDHTRAHPQPPCFFEDIHDDAEQSELFPSDVEAEVAERCFEAHLPPSTSGVAPRICPNCVWPSSPALLSLDADEPFTLSCVRLDKSLLPLGLDTLDRPRRPRPSFAEPYVRIPCPLDGIFVSSSSREDLPAVLSELWSHELATMLSRLHSGFRQIVGVHPRSFPWLDAQLLP